MKTDLIQKRHEEYFPSKILHEEGMKCFPEQVSFNRRDDENRDWEDSVEHSIEGVFFSHEGEEIYYKNKLVKEIAVLGTDMYAIDFMPKNVTMSELIKFLTQKLENMLE